jgi:hypothetical protein
MNDIFIVIEVNNNTFDVNAYTTFKVMAESEKLDTSKVDKKDLPFKIKNKTYLKTKLKS